MVKTPERSLTISSAPFRDRQDPIVLAAIDIGTNSIHMVVVQIDPTLPAFAIIAREKDTVRLGDRDPKSGALTPAAIERAMATLHRCQELAISFRAERVIAAATSAVREAPNGKDFIEQVEVELGLHIDLISGQEEARRIYLGVLSGMEFTSEPHVIIDIGGGSTELILADSYEPRYLSSTKVGAVRLTHEFVSTDPIDDLELTALRAYLRGVLERPVEQIQAALRPGETPRLVGTSGTIEALAVLHARQSHEAPPNPLNGYTVSRKALEAIAAKLAKLDYAGRCDMPGMSEKRAEIIVAGAAILTETMAMLDLDEIVLCERALREGTIVDWMLSHGLIDDRLRFQSEVRERSVYKLAQKYQVDLDYSQQVAGFAIDLFDQLQGKLHQWGDRERQLLWAAAMLHNSGLYISHAAHHKHSYYLIRHGELLGFTEMEVEVIANLARYHRKSKPKKKHPNFQNLPDRRYRHLVSELGAILRLSVALDRRQVGAVQAVECDYHIHHRELHLQLIPRDRGDDCALELWNLAYKKPVFEEEFDVKVVAAVAER